MITCESCGAFRVRSSRRGVSWKAPHALFHNLIVIVRTKGSSLTLRVRLASTMAMASAPANAAVISSAANDSPLAALSALATPASRQALCGTAGSSLASAAAQVGTPGCVLPIADATPPLVSDAPQFLLLGSPLVASQGDTGSAPLAGRIDRAGGSGGPGARQW